jgi:hypothetical protein
VDDIDKTSDGQSQTTSDVDIDDIIEQEINTGTPVDVDEEVGTDITDIKPKLDEFLDSDEETKNILPIIEGILQNDELRQALFDKDEIGIFIKTLPQSVKEKLFDEADLPSNTNDITLINLISEQENIN